MSREYNYDGVTLIVGLVMMDSNGYNWVIEWCGPKMVKYYMQEHPYDNKHYTSHWHFVENVVRRGMFSRPASIAHIIKRSIQNIKQEL